MPAVSVTTRSQTTVSMHPAGDDVAARVFNCRTFWRGEIRRWRLSEIMLRGGYATKR